MSYHKSAMVLTRICAFGIFVAAALFVRGFALQDILLSSVDRTHVVFGYAPQFTIQFLAWDASYDSALVTIFLLVFYGALAALAIALFFRSPQVRFPVMLLFVAMGLNLAERILYGGIVDYIRVGAVVMNLPDVVIIGSAGFLVYTALRKK